MPLNYDTELRARKLTQIIKANLEEVCANSIKRQNFYYPIKNPSIHAQLQRYEATQLWQNAISTLKIQIAKTISFLGAMGGPSRYLRWLAA